MSAREPLRPGYKQTEVGVIPEDWKVSSIGQVYSVSAGGDFDPLQSSDFRDEAHPYPIYSNALTNAGLYGFCSYCDHRAASITVTARGMLGSANFRDQAFTAIGRVIVLEPRVKQDGRLFSAFINERIQFAVESTGVPQLTAPQIAKYQLPVPPLPEQRAIATALSDVDALIASLDALIAKKRDLKQAAMQQLLTGKIRLPGFKAEWSETTVGLNAVLFAGGTPSTRIDGYWGGRIRWMSSGELHKKRVQDVEGRISELGLANSAAKKVPVNSVLVGLAGQGKTRGTVAINIVELTTNQSISAIVPSSSISADFLYHNLDHRYEELRYLSSGDGGRGGLNLKILSSLSLMLPRTLDEQFAIAAVLSGMDAELAALEAKRDKTRALKTGMMQELLTGRIRLI